MPRVRVICGITLAVITRRELTRVPVLLFANLSRVFLIPERITEIVLEKKGEKEKSECYYKISLHIRMYYYARINYTSSGTHGRARACKRVEFQTDAVVQLPMPRARIEIYFCHCTLRRDEI